MTPTTICRHGTRGPGLSGLALAALALAGPISGVSAQQDRPPPPLPLGEVNFPEFQERSLSNGARLLVVQNDEVPYVTINLVLRGGSSADPAGQEGIAAMTAQLLTQGTASRTGEQIADATDFLGSSLGAGASADWTTISMGSTLPALDPTLELMADVVMNPAFPQDKFDLFRTQTLSGLRIQASQAASIAARRYSQILYGSQHPYGRQQTASSVEALDRTAILDFHRTYFSPSTALFVVAGDISIDDAAARLESAFEGWDPTPVPDFTYPDTPDRVQPEIFLVHQPGTVQAEVRAGHLLMLGNHPDWTPLTVANTVLGGSNGRLFNVLREERGYTYGANSSVGRSRDRGVFTASMAVRNEVVGEAVNELLSLIGQIRTEPIPEDELRRTTDFLIGSFPLAIETPQQVASQVSNNRLLGLPADAIETYRGRVAALTPASVQRVVREQINPAKLVLVVVGDATLIRDQLQGMGPVNVIDVDGNPISMASLAPQAASETFSAAGLMPIDLNYAVLFDGIPVGSTVRKLEAGPEAGTLNFSSQTVLGPQTVDQSVTVRTADLGFVETSMRIGMQGQSAGGTVRAEGNRLVGTMTTPDSDEPIDMEAPEGVLVGEMVELALWVSELEVGRVLRLPVANVQIGTVDNSVMTVEALEELTIPAGTFQAYRIRVTGGDAQTIWVRAEGPHIMLRSLSEAQPIMVQLSSLPTGG